VSLRTELAGQTALPDFPARLIAAVERTSGVPELLALMEEFVPRVKEGPERRALLLRWAAVLELSGRWEEAAARYEEAAFAAPGQRDTESLLWAARAWLAAGEAEKALSILRILGAASPEASIRTRSLVLEGWARLIEGSAAEARSLAARAASSPPDRETLLAALTLLWAASEGPARGEAAARIRKDFPGSPEAAMVESGSVPPASHWLLTPAGGGTRPPGAPAPGSPAAPAALDSDPLAASSPPAASEPAPASARPSEPSRISSYQAGAFSEERNAAALVKELLGKGFAAVVERRERGGKPLWVVLVPAGADPQATLLRLKDAGYEAYPVF
jgi:tetratricopeptide (TPR) repeat protein